MLSVHRLARPAAGENRASVTWPAVGTSGSEAFQQHGACCMGSQAATHEGQKEVRAYFTFLMKLLATTYHDTPPRQSRTLPLILLSIVRTPPVECAGTQA